MYQSVKRVLTIVVLMAMFMIPKPALAVGGNTLEICAVQEPSLPSPTFYRDVTFGYYGPYGYFTLRTFPPSTPEACKYIGTEGGLGNGTYTVSQVIQSHWWASEIFCWNNNTNGTWTTNINNQSATVTFSGSNGWVQCAWFNDYY